MVLLAVCALLSGFKAGNRMQGDLLIGFICLQITAWALILAALPFFILNAGILFFNEQAFTAEQEQEWLNQIPPVANHLQQLCLKEAGALRLAGLAGDVSSIALAALYGSYFSL